MQAETGRYSQFHLMSAYQYKQRYPVRAHPTEGAANEEETIRVCPQNGADDLSPTKSQRMLREAHMPSGAEPRIHAAAQIGPAEEAEGCGVEAANVEPQ